MYREFHEARRQPSGLSGHRLSVWLARKIGVYSHSRPYFMPWEAYLSLRRGSWASRSQRRRRLVLGLVRLLRVRAG